MELIFNIHKQYFRSPFLRDLKEYIFTAEGVRQGLNSVEMNNTLLGIENQYLFWIWKF